MATLTETFEGAPVITYSGWTRNISEAHGGSFKYDSLAVLHGQSRTATITIPSEATSVRIWYYLGLSSGSRLDIDVVGGTSLNITSPNGSWTRTAAINVAGKTTLQLVVRNNHFQNDTDYARVDDIEFTIPDPSTNAEVTLATVAAVAGIPAPDVSAGSAAGMPSVAAAVDVPAPSASAGAGPALATVAAVVDVPAPTVTTDTAEVVTPDTVAAVVDVPAPDVSTSSNLIPATVAATVTVWGLDVQANASVTLPHVAAVVDVPAPAVQVPILPGDQMDGSAGQIEFNGTLLGRTTVYRWKNLAGWRDRPAVDSGNSPRPTRHGSWPGRPLLQERTIIWTALLRTARDQVEAAVNALEQALPVLDDETELPLVVNDLGTPYLIYGRIDRGPGLNADKRLRLGLGEMSLQWVCSDPRRYNINATGITIPVGDDAEIANAGNIETHPVLRVHGPATTPGVLNETLDRLVSFDVTLLDGELLVIDCDLGTATIDGTDVMGKLTGTSVHPTDWVLARGSNIVSHSAAADGAEADVLYRDAWA